MTRNSIPLSGDELDSAQAVGLTGVVADRAMDAGSGCVRLFDCFRFRCFEHSR